MTGATIPSLNATLAVLGAAAGGFLRRDELGFRILYTLPFGLLGLGIHALALMTLGLCAAPLWG